MSNFRNILYYILEFVWNLNENRVIIILKVNKDRIFKIRINYLESLNIEKNKLWQNITIILYTKHVVNV